MRPASTPLRAPRTPLSRWPALAAVGGGLFVLLLASARLPLDIVVPWVVCPVAIILGLIARSRFLAAVLATAASLLLVFGWLASAARAVEVGVVLLVSAAFCHMLLRTLRRRREGARSGWIAAFFARVTWPAVAVLDRVPYIVKLAVIWLLVLVPLGSVTKLEHDIAMERVVFSGRETLGVDYVEPVRALIFAVQRHRLLDAALRSGDEAVRTDLDLARADAERAVGQVDEVDAKLGGESPSATIYGAGLKTTKRWNEAKGAWAVVAKGGFSSVKDADAAHAACSKVLLDLILIDAANHSNLILDPDLDSYWLMDAFVGKLPRLTEAIVRSATLVIRPGGDATGQSERLIELAGAYGDQTRLVTDLVSINMATVFNETPSFSKSKTVMDLDAPLGAAHLAVTSAANAVRREHLLRTDASAAQQRETTRRALEALSASHELWSRVGPELRRMCERRVELHRRESGAGLVMTGLGTLVLAYVLVGFYSSVRRAVTDLGGAAKRMIAGQGEEFVVASRDEVADIAESFNQINEALVEARALRREREMLAQELHDEILQRLYAIGLQLEVAHLDSRDPEVRDRVAMCTTDLNEVIRGVRRVIVGAESGLVDSAGLERTLRSLAEGIGDRAPAVEFELDEGLLRSITKGQAQRLAAVAREAMRQSKDLAGAKHARLSLKRTDGHVVLEWEDDGAELASGGVPCSSMTMRMVAELGGVFEQDASRKGNHMVFRFPEEIPHA